jgi:hypothetical protein
MAADVLPCHRDWGNSQSANFHVYFAHLTYPDSIVSGRHLYLHIVDYCAAIVGHGGYLCLSNVNDHVHCHAAVQKLRLRMTLRISPYVF